VRIRNYLMQLCQYRLSGQKSTNNLVKIGYKIQLSIVALQLK